MKHLILTGAGCDLKQRLEAELSARMPWSSGLTDAERVQLLALIRKMLSATPPADDPGTGDPGCLTAAPIAGSSATAREVEASLGAAPTARMNSHKRAPLSKKIAIGSQRYKAPRSNAVLSANARIL